MATKTVKKNELPKISKKWYNFKIDPKTLRPVRFSWWLSSGQKGQKQWLIMFNNISLIVLIILLTPLHCILSDYLSNIYLYQEHSNRKLTLSFPRIYFLFPIFLMIPLILDFLDMGKCFYSCSIRIALSSRSIPHAPVQLVVFLLLIR